MEPSATDPARLLEHAAWLHRLARQLVRDEATADDVVQETWLRALQSEGSGAPARGRGWLARIARNVVYERWRRQGARRRREERAARPEAVESGETIVDRAEMQHRLLAAVLAVDEPFRTALLLHWFDGLRPAQIAERDGLPVATVRTRLWRGMNQLRERLDRDQGGSRRDWALGLIPLATRDATAGAVASGAAATGVLAMVVSNKVAVVAGALLLGVGAAWVLLAQGSVERVPPRVVGRAADVEPASGATLQGAGRFEASGAGSVRRDEEHMPIVGSVRTAMGLPISGARVRAVAYVRSVVREIGTVETGSDGRFAFARAALDTLGRDPWSSVTTLDVVATAPGYLPSPEDLRRIRLVDVLRNEEPTDLSLVLEPGHVVHGLVVDRRGAPAAASVTLKPRARGEGASYGGASEGHYRFPIRAKGSYVLTAELSGVGAGEAGPLDLDPSEDLEVPPIELGGAGFLAGTAHFPDGSPAPGARIGCQRTPYSLASREGMGWGHAYSDDLGRFRIEGLRPGDYIVFFGDPHGEPPPTHETGTVDIDVLVPLHHVRARVVDETGAPIPGIPVVGRWVHPSEDGAEDARNVDFDSGRPTDDRGLVDWWASAGDVLQLAVDEEGLALAEAEVRIEAPTWSRDVTLRVAVAAQGDAARPAHLKVRWLGPDGEPVPARVTVESPVSHIPVAYRKAVRPDEALDVPPGRWIVLVEAGSGTGPALDYLFPEERTIEFRAGETEVVEAVARPAGRLRLTVRGVSEEAWRAADASLLVTPLSGGAPVRVRAFWTGAGSSILGSLRPPASGISAARFVPGRHAVRFEGKGFAPIEAEIDVPAGGHADLSLEPKVSETPIPLSEVVLPQIEWRGESLETLLEYVATRTGRVLRITEAARAQVAGTLGTASFTGQKATALLVLFVESQGLVWKDLGDALWIGTKGETP